MKISRTVLKTSRRGDPVAEFNKTAHSTDDLSRKALTVCPIRPLLIIWISHRINRGPGVVPLVHIDITRRKTIVRFAESAREQAV